ncbi:MAG: alpha/beta hydrolase-fold protein [Prevotella sp.]|jgi:predicted esterase YcpF (UPF0227 family)
MTEKLDLHLPASSYIVYGSKEPKVVLVQTLDTHEIEGFEHEVELIGEGIGNDSFAIIGAVIHDWELELMPWADKNVSHRPEVGTGASATLSRLTGEVHDAVQSLGEKVPMVLGGYSLGGLFSLWAVTQTDMFQAAAGMSPSLWVEGWDEYTATHQPHVNFAYLSLGDREEKAKRAFLARVGDRVRSEYSLLQQRLGAENTTLVWNPGNHFQNFLERTADGFVWCSRKLLKRS